MTLISRLSPIELSRIGKIESMVGPLYNRVTLIMSRVEYVLLFLIYIYIYIPI